MKLLLNPVVGSYVTKTDPNKGESKDDLFVVYKIDKPTKGTSPLIKSEYKAILKEPKHYNQYKCYLEDKNGNISGWEMSKFLVVSGTC